MSRELLSAVLERLERVKGPDARGWFQARCPFADHPDKNPSFGLTETGFKCHGCGRQGSLSELAKEFGLDLTEGQAATGILDRPAADAWLHNRGLRPKTIRHFRIEADLTKQAWRYPAGSDGHFRLKAFDSTRKQKYWWDPKKPADGDVYNLDPHVGAAEAWLVEGEPDVWIMHQAGIPAFTFTGGAENVPAAGIRAVVEARIGRVHVCYDNDAAGQDGARKVAAALKTAGVDSAVRALPSSVGDKGDVTTLYNQMFNSDAKFRAALNALPTADTPPAPDKAAAADANAWGPPVPFDHVDLPPFPTSALVDWLEAFVEAEATATQTPEDLAGMLVLSACAAAVAGKIEVQVRSGWREPLNLYTAAVLLPGNRKSAVLSDISSPLEELEREEVERLEPVVTQALNTRKIREAALHKAQKDAATHKDPDIRLQSEDEARKLARELAESPVPILPRLLADDATPEALTSLLAEQGGRIAVLSAEGGVFDLMAGRYSSNGGPNLEVYLKAHAGDSLRVDRKGRVPEYIPRPALTLGLAVQPDVLRALADKPEFRGRGLLARFLYALPRSPLGRRTVDPPPVPEEVRSSYTRNLRALAEAARPDEPRAQWQPHLLRISAEAQASLRVFQEWVEPQLAEFGTLGTMTDWGGKLVGAVLRIAGVLHLAEHALEKQPRAGTISPETLGRAIRIGEYLVPHARAAYRQLGGDPVLSDAQHVWRSIERAGVTEISRRDLHRAVEGRFPTTPQLDAPLARLVERGFLRERPGPQQGGSGRRPSPVFEVNPLALRAGDQRQNRQNGQNELGEPGSVDSVDYVGKETAQ